MTVQTSLLKSQPTSNPAGKDGVVAGAAPQDRCLLAGSQLFVRRPDLSLRNPLLKEPLKLIACEATRGRPLGHDAGTELIYVHLNRVIKKYDLDMFYIAGPGHGGPALVGNVTSKGPGANLSEYQPGRSGLEKTVQGVLLSRRNFESCCANNSGSIHEGGELGYSLSHAFGAAFDNPD